jgi:hypothetical protein
MHEYIITTVKNNSHYQLNEYFNTREFQCRCNACPFTLIASDIINILYFIRKKFNKPIIITSAFRCYFYHQHIYKKKYYTYLKEQRDNNKPFKPFEDFSYPQYSSHLIGIAVDIKSDYNIFQEVLELFNSEYFPSFTGLGVDEEFLHIDVRKRKEKEIWHYGI